jgi:hypothetical protein
MLTPNRVRAVEELGDFQGVFHHPQGVFHHPKEQFDLPAALVDGLDVAQRRGACQLGEQQRNELMARRETARQRVRPIFAHQPVEGRPRHEFEDVVKNGFLKAHGVDIFSCPRESRNTGNE